MTKKSTFKQERDAMQARRVVAYVKVALMTTQRFVTKLRMEPSCMCLLPDSPDEEDEDAQEEFSFLWYAPAAKRQRTEK